MPQTHLMIVPPGQASLIMTGQKPVEARFSPDRRAPFGVVSPGDNVYIQPSGQRIIGKAIVHRVDQYEGLTPADVDHLRTLYQDRVLSEQIRWGVDARARYATFITFSKVTLLREEPVIIGDFKGARGGSWRVLAEAGGEALRAA
ncbi:MAG: hypothetical protein WD114_01385 [Phycisphaerales bacterium]